MYWQKPRELFDSRIIVSRKKNFWLKFWIIVGMDLWVVAAAAGAGYLAKNLQNLPSSEKQRLAESSSRFSLHTSLESRNFLQQIRDRSCPLRRLAQENRIKDTSDEQKDGFSRKDSILQSTEFVGNSDCSSFEFGKFKLQKNGASGYFVKPLSPLQSDLGSQLHKVQEEEEEYVHSSVPPPWISTIKSLLITEEIENISRSPSDSSLGKTKRVPGNASHSPGSPNHMFILMIGIAIGIVATVIADGNEVTNLNEQLKQANSFVQDLQEELEMKEKLTVKDLADEESQSLTRNNISLCNQEPESDEHEASENEIIEAGDHLGSSEIEAELEAELERLELNMKSSVMDTKSGFSQLDQEFEAFTAPEHMKLNLLSGQYTDDSSETDYDEESGNRTEQNLPSNYAVSPRELSIKLHEVIESRLEERIRELETAIQNSQNRLQFLETECVVSQDMASNPESPAPSLKPWEELSGLVSHGI